MTGGDTVTDEWTRSSNPARRANLLAMDADPFDLDRFVKAQAAGRVYEHALRELRAGCKQSHWMWFVFPQIAGLGHSAMAQRYAIRSLDEARAYAAHPILGARLRECVAALNELATTDAGAVLGSIDAVKLRSSLTLFARAEPGERAFTRCLEHFFGGVEDDATLARLRGA